MEVQKYVVDQMYHYPPLGTVRITVRQNSRSITARWKNGIVQLNIPARATGEMVTAALEKFTPALLRKKPSLQYFEGQRIELDGLTIVIGRQSLKPQNILGQSRLPESVVSVGTEYDFTDEITTKGVSNVMCGIARRLAEELLFPLAKATAKRVGVSPRKWEISTGHRTLGKCDSDGVISLSYLLVFLPAHLREYIICHELAHLSEMNHSVRFHRLCDQYCNGNETRYIAELKTYPWPILK